MLEQKYRFHGHSSLRYLYQHGKTQRGRSLSIRFARNQRRADSRCAVVVTRKVLKAAPKRNRVRRRLYELLRTNWTHVKTPYDISISVYDPHLYDMPYHELTAIVIDTLKRAELWQD